MENETKESLIIDAVVNAPTEVSPEMIENTQENIKKKKIIIIGAPEKISPKMLENIQKHYGDKLEIEFMTKEKCMSSYPEFLENIIQQEREAIEAELKRMELMDYLPSALPEDEKTKPEFPKTIGKVNNKKLSQTQKQHYKQKRGR